jgi:hypothetical protein
MTNFAPSEGSQQGILSDAVNKPTHTAYSQRLTKPKHPSAAFAKCKFITIWQKHVMDEQLTCHTLYRLHSGWVGKRPLGGTKKAKRDIYLPFVAVYENRMVLHICFQGTRYHHSMRLTLDV